MTGKTFQLPAGWEPVALADVTTPSTEKAEPIAFGDSTYLGLEHIEGGTNRIIGTGDIASVKSTKAVFRAGDVLYGKLRPYLNKVCRPDFDGVCSTDILVYPNLATLNNEYLLHFLSSPSTTEYATQNANGINLPRVNAKVLGILDFPLPPIAEQARIVAKVNTLQKRSGKARDTLMEAGPLLEQFRQSQLAAAFRGDLSADWRTAHSDVEPATELLARIRQERRQNWEQIEAAKYETSGKKPPKGWKDKYKEPEPLSDYELKNLPSLPGSWCWVSLMDVHSAIAPFCYGVVQPGPEVDEGAALVRVQDMNDGRVITKQLRTIGDDIHKKYARSQLKGGEVLVSVVGTIGRVAVTDEHVAGANIARAIARVTPVAGLRPDWIAGSIESPRANEWLQRGSREVARKTLNLNVLERIAVPLAPQAEMDQIIRLLRESKKVMQQLKVLVDETKSDLSKLEHSILAKAFRGELASQDPNDEPASKLVKRIQADRESAKTRIQKKRPSRGKKTMAVINRETVQAALDASSLKKFTFEDLREVINGDYESLKDVMFLLLDDPDSGLKQYFDVKDEVIKFERATK